MEKLIEIHRNKSLRLDNVLINKVVQISTLDTETSNDDEVSIELEVSKMNNEIRSKGAIPVGPLIQYSGTKYQSDDNMELKICLMLQSDKYISNISNPFMMESVISVKKCMYARFIGLEDDINFAYQKLQVDAYENDIKLNGNSYTIFLGSDEETGYMTADIFLEKDDK